MLKRVFQRAGICMMVLLAVYLVPGCSEEGGLTIPEDQTQSEAPELPAMSTMTFSLDFFGVEMPAVDQQSLATGKPSAQMQATAPGDHSNFINAVVRALYVRLITFDALAEPIAAFALAAHSVPQKQDDGSYLWTYIFVEDQIEYSVFLYGTPMSDRAEWRLEVSTNDPDFLLDHFKWFEGETMNDGSQGYWQFFEPVLGAPAVAAATTSAATDGTGIVRIDYQNPSKTEHRLTVTVNGVGREDEGDTLEFHETATMGEIVHYDASEDLTSKIDWFADGSGSITVPDYNNGEQACWDTMQVNTVCPTS